MPNSFAVSGSAIAGAGDRDGWDGCGEIHASGLIRLMPAKRSKSRSLLAILDFSDPQALLVCGLRGKMMLLPES